MIIIFMSFAGSKQKTTDDISSNIEKLGKIWNLIKNDQSNTADSEAVERINQNNSNFQTYKRKIEKGIGQATEELKEEFQKIVSDYEKKWPNIESKINSISAATQNAKTQEQIRAERQHDEIEYLDKNVDEIVDMTKSLNEVTHKVDDQVQADHAVIQRIDGKIEDAKTDMVEGNKELEAAEEHQKKCVVI